MKIDPVKIKASIEEYLKANGWGGPNTNTDGIVINSLDPIFKKLVAEGLVQPSMANEFFNSAISEKQKSDFFRIMGM